MRAAIIQILLKWACLHVRREWNHPIPVYAGSSRPCHYDQMTVCAKCGKFKRLKL